MLEITQLHDRLYIKSSRKMFANKDVITLDGIEYIEWEWKCSLDDKTHFWVFITYEDYKKRMDE